MTTAKEAYELYKNHEMDRAEAEGFICESARHSYYYSNYILNGRFELGEAAISTNPSFSYWYAQFVLKGRFILGETAICTSKYYTVEYAKNIVEGRFPLGEEIILTSAYAYAYIRKYALGMNK